MALKSKDLRCNNRGSAALITGKKGLKLRYCILILMIAACQNKTQQQDARYVNQGEDQAKELTRFGIKEKKVPQGLNTGSPAPGFSGKDQFGNLIDLKKMLEEKPVVLFFYRGRWCPVCNRYLSNFQDSLHLIAGEKAKVIAVSPELPQNAEKTAQKVNAGFSVISDTSHRIMRSYDVRFAVTGNYEEMISKNFGNSIAANNGDKKAYLPVPATYIIDQNGKITWKYFNYNYKKRASVKAIQRELEGM